MKASLPSRFSHFIAPFLAKGSIPASAYEEVKRSLHREIASRVAAVAKNNAVLATPPPTVALEKDSLPCPYRSVLSQLCLGYCSSLTPYTFRV
jgi:hypothetical protein